MTDPVIAKLNYIRLFRVPTNRIQIFQPLYLTVNGSGKSYLKRRFIEFGARNSDELDFDMELEDIEIKLHLSVFRGSCPEVFCKKRCSYTLRCCKIHRNHLCQSLFLNKVAGPRSSQKSQEVIEHGWKSAGVNEVISVVIKDLPSLDPLASVDPLDEAMTDFTVMAAADTNVESFVTL